MKRSDQEGHIEQLSRVYSPVTWDVYARLDRSLDPRGPDWLLQRAAEYLTPGATVLDAGCRDAAHLIRLVQGHGVTGVGVDPVPVHVERGRTAVESMGLHERITIAPGTMEDAPRLGQQFDLIWCRDVLEQVADLSAALDGVAQVLKRSGRMVVFTTLATELLEPAESAMLNRHLGNVAANLVETNVEAAFTAAGLEIEDKDIIGTEWREYAEERTQPVSTALLRLARLRRTRDSVVAHHGQDVYSHIEANLHWELFQFLGKLRPTVYVLRHA
jgi:cyclopropane fatty-acyl-phospholipid synthase-like methyltransferase